MHFPSIPGAGRVLILRSCASGLNFARGVRSVGSGNSLAAAAANSHMQSRSAQRYSRAGVRLQHLASVVAGGGSSPLQTDSLHSRELRRHQGARGASSGGAVAAVMAPQGKFAYAVVYVKDVAQSVEFYKKAFGIDVRSVDKSKRWGELESGQTTIAFTPLEQHETDITGGVQTPDLGEPRHNVELSFSYSDVEAAFKHAVSEGAVPVAKPEEKPWGQKVAYVRDINGVMIRLGSDM